MPTDTWHPPFDRFFDTAEAVAKARPDVDLDLAHEVFDEVATVQLALSQLEHGRMFRPATLVVFRYSEDNLDTATKSFTELLKLPEDQAMQNIEIKGITFAEPGKVGTGYADLDPGEYLAICFIPKGASEAKPDGDGPPHFMLGMQQEFTVK